MGSTAPTLISSTNNPTAPITIPSNCTLIIIVSSSTSVPQLGTNYFTSVEARGGAIFSMENPDTDETTFTDYGNSVWYYFAQGAFVAGANSSQHTDLGGGLGSTSHDVWSEGSAIFLSIGWGGDDPVAIQCFTETITFTYDFSSGTYRIGHHHQLTTVPGNENIKVSGAGTDTWTIVGISIAICYKASNRGMPVDISDNYSIA